MQAWRNPHLVSYAQAAAAFAAREQTPRDFLERCIAAIEAHESRIQAFVSLDLKMARAAADASSKRWRAGKPLSPIDGCPVAIKDIMATADLPTQMGSPAFQGWQSGQDAACVHALRRGGALIFNKTVTTEFAIGFSGPTTNPFNARHTPGGSSSGTAAAVGGGMLPVGLGTQTQGSTLRPASFCGAVGFKPTLHAFNTAGIHPLSSTCDHLGVIGATLEDTWMIASQLSLGIGSPGYGFLNGAAATPPVAVQPHKLVVLHTRGWQEIDEPTRNAFNATLRALQDAGIEIVSEDEDPRVQAFEAALERDIDGALDIVAYEMQWPYRDYIARFGRQIGKRIHGLIKRADVMVPADYAALLETRQSARRHARELLITLGADAFVTLASSGPAPRGLKESGSRSFLTPASWLGFPAFALPLMESGGLPFGLQLMGADHLDGNLFAAARWIMREFT